MNFEVVFDRQIVQSKSKSNHEENYNEKELELTYYSRKYPLNTYRISKGRGRKDMRQSKITDKVH